MRRAIAPSSFSSPSAPRIVASCWLHRKLTGLLIAAWGRAAHWLVGRYVIMPDHIHLFCSPGVLPAHPLGLWVKYWQNLVTRNWSKPEEKPIWQKEYWDRQLRSGDSYGEKWDYVMNNPVRHKLCAANADWPYQGELKLLAWHRP